MPLARAAVEARAAALPADHHDVDRASSSACCRSPSARAPAPASRHSLGTGVIGGMLAATFIATFFIPLFFRWIAGLRRKGEQHGTEVSQVNA